MAAGSDSWVMFQIRIREHRPLSQESPDSARVIRSELCQIVIAELVDCNEQDQPNRRTTDRLRRRERYGKSDDDEKDRAQLFQKFILNMNCI